jgi:hypothetical protein
MKKMMMLAALMIMCPLSARADFQKGSQTLNFHIGGGSTQNEFEWSSSSPDGRDEEAADGGPAGGGQYVYYLHASPGIGIGFDISHTGLKDHSASQVFPNLDSNSNFKPTTFLAIGKLAYPRGMFRPYLLGGIGLHSTDMLLELTPNNATWADTGTTETRRVIDGSGNGFAAALGVGLDWFPIETLFFGLELRTTYLGSSGYGVTSEGRRIGFTEAEGDLSFSNIFLRAGFKFGA